MKDLKPFDRVIVKCVDRGDGSLTIVDFPNDWNAEQLWETEVIFLGYTTGSRTEAIVQPIDKNIQRWEIDTVQIANMRDYTPGANYDEASLVGKPGWYVLMSGIIGKSDLDAMKREIDGMHCVQCREFSPMASANTPDDKFKCFQCREDRFRMSY